MQGRDSQKFIINKTRPKKNLHMTRVAPYQNYSA